MANPVLSDKQLAELSQRGTWAPPDPSTRALEGRDTMSTWDSGPSRAAGDRMTMRGVASASGVLLALIVAAGIVGWMAVPDPEEGFYSFPRWTMIGIIVGFVCVLVANRKPHLAKFLAPVYAIAEGVFVGAISHAYENLYDGIVIQAVGATAAVFAVMLFLHSSRILKVTDRMRRIVVSATMGLMLFYLVSFVVDLITNKSVSFLHSSSPIGIGFSVLVVGLAAFNLSIDFDTIERGVRAQMPKGMEWVCALGLVVTIVWLYLEILRLLAKLNRR